MRTLLWKLAVVCVAYACAAYAQTSRGTVSGTVIDASGAVVPGASVTVIGTETGTRRSTFSNEAGIYRVPQLPVGSYELRVEKPGFASLAYPAFVLSLNQVARIDAEMKVGQVSETVEVTSAPPILKTESTQVDTIIDSTTNDALPLATRNYVELQLARARVHGLNAGVGHAQPLWPNDPLVFTSLAPLTRAAAKF